MIQVLQFPKIVDLADNNCGMIVKGTNYYINQGQSASFQILQAGALRVVSIYVPDIQDGGSIRFDVVPTPDDTGYELEEGITAEETAQQIRENYKVSRYWNVWFDGAGVIKFQTWAKGYFVIDDGSINVVPASLPISNVVNGIATSIQEGYKLFYLVEVEREYLSGTFAQMEFFGDADENGEMPIHLSFLKSFFIERDLPAVNANTFITLTQTIKRYKLAVAEFYDSIMKKLYETDIFYMLPGKVNPIDYPGLNLPDLVTDTLAYLKHGADEIKSTTETQQYLNFLAPVDYAGQTYLKTELFFDDGTGNEINNVNVIVDLQQYRILRLPVGFRALGFDAHAKSANIYKYQVSLYDVGNTIRGRLITYFIRPHDDRDFVFLYENRFGVFDTLIAIGEMERKHIISNELHQKYLPLDYEFTDTQFISENKDDYPTFKANTGAYTLDLAEEIEAMLSANHFYQIVNNSYKRCELMKSSKTVSDTSENLHNIEFEYRYALK